VILWQPSQLGLGLGATAWHAFSTMGALVCSRVISVPFVVLLCDFCIAMNIELCMHGRSGECKEYSYYPLGPPVSMVKDAVESMYTVRHSAHGGLVNPR